MHSMGEPAPAEAILSCSELSRCKRLTIGHLLLWTATTGMALAYFQSQRPPPPEKIGFASFLHQPGTDVEAEMAKARQRIWHGWQRGYLINLAASPIYGVALAGIGLAIGRMATGRLGFPSQPGHWLLLEIGAMAGLVASRPLLRWLPLSPDGHDFVLASLLLVVAIGTALVVCRSAWLLPMATAAGGFAVICLAYLVSFGSASSEPPGLYGVGLIVIGTVPFLALLVTILDLADRKRYDLFHWLGVATLFGIVGHFLALFGAAKF